MYMYIATAKEYLPLRTSPPTFHTLFCLASLLPATTLELEPPLPLVLVLALVLPPSAL